jgi:penicillin-binding protein 2
MRNEQLEVRQRFEMRMMFFYAVMPIFIGILMFHLLKLQWFEYEKYSLQSDQNRLNIVPVLPARGEILDARGRGLAINHIAYSVLLIPERVKEIEPALLRLAGMLQWDADKIALIRKRIRRARPDRPVLLDDKLSWQQVAPIAAHLHHMPGVDVQAGSYRVYPYAELTSHIVGYLSLARDNDLKVGYLPTEFIGRTGVERSFEPLLHGALGSQQEEVDAHGRRVAVLKQSPSRMGEPIRLALDVDVQQAASDALGDRTGAVVVLNVHTGAIISMLSKPGYDTNHFITGVENRQWQSWLNDVEKPLLNRSIQASYPPASTFKLVTALAGLRQHERMLDEGVNCPGYFELSGRKFRCWKRAGHQQTKLHKALVQSCDVFFYKLGDELGMAQISNEAQQWGLGEKTGVALSAESRGIIPAHHPYMMAAMKSKTQKRKKWFRGETIITAIGQGAITTTPLQMARLVAAIANGGYIYRPQLLADVAAEVMHTVDVAPEHLLLIRKAMRDVVASPHGTAHRALASLPWTMAGKTGTAQVVTMAQDEADRGRQKRTQIKRHKDHAWFVGYAPYEHPEIAIAVFVEHGGSGGHSAAPVAAAVIRRMAALANEQKDGPGS